MNGPTLPTEPRHTSRRRWARRARFWAVLTGIGVLVQWLAQPLPGAVPLLLGNTAPLALQRYLRWPWVLASALLVAVAGGSGGSGWIGYSLLHAAMALGFRHRWPRARWSLPLKCVVLLPIAAWLAGPEVIGLLVAATGVGIVHLGSRNLDYLGRDPQVREAQGMAAQLSASVAVPTLTMLIVGLLVLQQWSWLQRVQRSAVRLHERADTAVALVETYLQTHVAAIRMAARDSRVSGRMPMLDGVAENYPGFLTLLVSDAQGNLIDFRSPSLPDTVRNVADRHYFREPRRSGRAFVSPVFRGRGFGDDVLVAVSAPYTDARGQFAGVVEGSLSLQILRERLQRMSGLTEMEFAVIDTGGKVVATTLAGVQALDALPSAQAGGASWRGIALNRQRTHLRDVTRVPSLGWRVVMLEPVAPLALAYSQAVLRVGVLYLLVFGAILLASRRLGARYAQPLQLLEERLRQLDLSQPQTLAPIDAPGTHLEFVRLRDVFNAMALRLREIHGELQRSLDALAALNRDLEARVEQRTGELREAVAQTRRLADAKAQLLANMSHELRTPLAAILAHAEQQLDHGGDRGNGRAVLELIVRNGRHLLGVINDVLEASRIESGQLRVERTAVDALAIVDDVRQVFQAQAEQKGLGFVVEYQWPLPARLQTDALRLRQVLFNLVGNAIKFTLHGQVRITVSAEQGRWQVAISDSGIGMTAEQQTRLFNAFEQGDVSTTRRFGGSGLGLHISARLVEVMGGQLHVHSAPEQGSTFTLSLPLPAEVTWRSSLEVSDAVRAVAAPVPRLGGRVLIAEDVADLRAALGSMVASTGAQVECVEDGAQAVARVRGGGIDLVLMDIHMPVLDGMQATAQLRRDGWHGPIIALSADVLGSGDEARQRDGFDGALAKPIDRAAFNATLAAHLPSAQAAAMANDNAHGALEQMLASLREDYRGRLAEKAMLLESVLDQPEALAEHLHSLKGTSGTLGLDEVCALASEVEQALLDGQSYRSAGQRLLAVLRREAGTA